MTIALCALIGTRRELVDLQLYNTKAQPEPGAMPYPPLLSWDSGLGQNYCSCSGGGDPYYNP